MRGGGSYRHVLIGAVGALGMGLLILSVPLRAQTRVHGQVRDTAGLPLFPATVLDKTTREITYSDSLGRYQLQAFSGDTLVFSFVGYRARAFRVPDRYDWSLDVTLSYHPQNLRAVEVRAGELFLPDSLWKIYTSPAPEPARNRLLGGSDFGGGGFGLVFHPFTYFSKAEHQKRRLHKMQLAQDHEKFSDAAYTPEIVHRITGLSGDSLRQFLQIYHPTYGFSRKATQLEYFSWILIQYRSWLSDSAGQ